MGIRLSEKHGVNPSINMCFYCNEDKNEIVLPGRLKGDAEAPHKAVWDMEPCDKCKEHMKQGVICISVRKGEMDKSPKNPYRTGGWCVIKDEAITRIVEPKELCDDILKKRVVFLEDDTWDLIGLPRPKVLDK